MSSTEDLDFRVRCGYFDHHKTGRLEKRCGPLAPYLFLRLWAWARQNRPDGRLNLDTEAIEHHARWPGEAGKFVEALLAVGYLDGAERNYQLHDWEEHQPWSTGAERRSIRGTRAALKRHGVSEQEIGKILKRKYKSACSVHAKRKPEQCPDSVSVSVSETVSDSVSITAGKAERKWWVETAFPEFWRIYPRKTAKADALRAWEKIAPDRAMFTTIMDAVEAQRRSEQWAKDGGSFIPYPATWLNSRRWEDEVAPLGLNGHYRTAEDLLAEAHRLRAAQGATGDYA